MIHALILVAVWSAPPAASLAVTPLAGPFPTVEAACPKDCSCKVYGEAKIAKPAKPFSDVRVVQTTCNRTIYADLAIRLDSGWWRLPEPVAAGADRGSFAAGITRSQVDPAHIGALPALAWRTNTSFTTTREKQWV